MKKLFFNKLLSKISDGTASDEELLLYQNWYNTQLLEPIDATELKNAKSGITETIYRKILDQLQKQEAQENAANTPKVKTTRRLLFWAAAAVMLITLGLTFYHFKTQTTIDLIQEQYTYATSEDTQNDIVLTLADGKKVNLSNSSNGEIKNLADLNISKAKNLINYSSIEKVKNNPVEGTIIYNSLYIPSGKTFQIILSDGTKVWLNAKSILRYPTNFTENERKVQLIGEGYFEAASNPNKPFIVESPGQELKVLGTKFNISAYTDKSIIHSSVLEGKVSVKNTKTNESLKLLPGDQSVLSEENLQKQKVLLKNVLGWKNGFFVFHNEKFGNICNSLARWYNVEFDSSKNPKILNQIFSGRMPQFNTVDEVLMVLSETGTINYKREGRRIILMN